MARSSRRRRLRGRVDVAAGGTTTSTGREARDASVGREARDASVSGAAASTVAVAATATATSALTSAHIARINATLVSGNIGQLRELSYARGGYLLDGVRRRVWPRLLGMSYTTSGDNDTPSGAVSAARLHRDTDQVERDVARSLVHFHGEHDEAAGDVRDDDLDAAASVQRAHRRRQLSRVLDTVLAQNPLLHYYQGLHDVATVLLLVLGEHAATLALERLVHLHLRDFMLPTMGGTLRMLQLMVAVVDREDLALAAVLRGTGTADAHFAVSWILTYYSHNARTLAEAARLFDFLLASNPLMGIYLAAAVTLMRKREVLDAAEHALEDGAFAGTFRVLQRWPTFPYAVKDDRGSAEVVLWSLDDVIAMSLKLFERHPPNIIQQTPGLLLDPLSCVNRYPIDVLGVTYVSESTLLFRTRMADMQRAFIASEEGKHRITGRPPPTRRFRLRLPFGLPRTQRQIIVVSAISAMSTAVAAIAWWMSVQQQR